jgi:hypothetical protein
LHQFRKPSTTAGHCLQRFRRRSFRRAQEVENDPAGHLAVLKPVEDVVDGRQRL